MTHDYSRAVKYYETQIAQDERLLDLRQDLAELYFRLKAFEDAKRVLIDALKYLTTPDWDFTRRGYLRAKTAVLSTMGEWKVHPTRNLTVKRIPQLYKRLRDI